MKTVKGENRYSFLATDTETEELVEVNESGEVIWKIDTALTVFDLWHLSDDRILFCHSSILILNHRLHITSKTCNFIYIQISSPFTHLKLYYKSSIIALLHTTEIYHRTVNMDIHFFI